MSKKYFFLAMATVALASCSQEETIEINKGQAIDFRVSTEYNTRAVAYSSTNHMPDFKVTAFAENEANHFTNQLWKNSGYNTTTPSWSTTDAAYWPNDETKTLKFYAYSPADLVGVSIDKSAQTISNYTPEKNSSAQKDVLVAYNTGNGKDNKTGVGLNFKHLLSQIVVKANCENDNYTVKVKGVKLTYFKNSASIDFPNEVITNDSEMPSWDFPTEPTYEYYLAQSASTVTLTNDAEFITNKTNGAFMVLPQQLEAWNGEGDYSTTDKTYSDKDGAYISLLCNIEMNGKPFYPKNKNKYAYSAIPVDTDLKMGKKYTYTLTFFDKETNGGAGQIDPNPGDGGDGDTDPTPEPEGGTNENGDIVTGAPIKFSVTVDNWTPETVNKNM